MAFKEGDLVWVTFTKDRQPARPFVKLLDRKVGPCRVLKKINENAYKVELPTHLQISNSFNVQHLTPYYQDDDQDEDPV